MKQIVEKIKQQLDTLESEDRQEVFDHLMRVAHHLEYNCRDGDAEITKSLDGARGDRYTFGPLTVNVGMRT